MKRFTTIHAYGYVIKSKRHKNIKIEYARALAALNNERNQRAWNDGNSMSLEKILDILK